ncbi:class I SAM-dependent methyltransferase [bacterium]|nr:class I SAM-dependent methyltransferase [bacterium]
MSSPSYKTRFYDNYNAHFTYANPSTGLYSNYYDRCYNSLLPSLPNQARILDLGCGTGDLLTWLAKHQRFELFGVDLSRSQLERFTHSSEKIHIHVGDGLDYLQSSPETFDFIFCNDLLEHLQKPDLLNWLDSIFAALKPGGGLSCRVPNAANLTGLQLRYADFTHELALTSLSLRDCLEVSGFTQVCISPVYGSTFPATVRHLLSHYLHWGLYRLSGCGNESVFSRNICGNGRKPLGSSN